MILVYIFAMAGLIVLPGILICGALLIWDERTVPIPADYLTDKSTSGIKCIVSNLIGMDRKSREAQFSSMKQLSRPLYLLAKAELKRQESVRDKPLA
jgi:hypothetical protein